jgi:threonine aldolase
VVLDLHTDEHMVKPRLVYLSNSTEIGSIYLKGELTRLSRFCREHDLYLYLDGARLGSALCSEQRFSRSLCGHKQLTPPLSTEVKGT